MAKDDCLSYDLGKRTKELISKTGLTVYAFCDLKGISQSQLTKWIGKNTDPRLSSVVKVSRALGISVGALIDPMLEGNDSASYFAFMFWWNQLSDQEQIFMLNAMVGIVEKSIPLIG